MFGFGSGHLVENSGLTWEEMAGLVRKPGTLRYMPRIKCRIDSTTGLVYMAGYFQVKIAFQNHVHCPVCNTI